MNQRIATTASGVAFAVTGSGPPLVYASGWLGHLELSWAIPAERAWYEALADGRTLIRYDKPGCGRSGRDADGSRVYTMDDELDALRAVVAATGVTRFDLLGASLGAPVAA